MEPLNETQELNMSKDALMAPKPLPDYRLMKKKSGELVLQQRFTLESYVRYDLVWEDVPTVKEDAPPEER